MNKFKLEAPQFFSTVTLKGSSYTAFIFKTCYLRLISTIGREKDLSASITRAFSEEEMSRDGTGSLLPFVKLATISLFQILGIAANISVIEKNRANAKFAFKVFKRKELVMDV